MGLFGPTSTVFDEQLDKATDECNTKEDWGLIMSICDKVKTSPDGPKEFCKAIVRRITQKNPHVSLQALTVLDSCVNNCGVDFKKEVASQDFISQMRGIMGNPPHPKVQQHLKMLIRQWAEDFKDDPQLSKLTSFYHFMRSEGVEFPTPEEVNPKKSAAPVSKDPNVVSSQQEADDIAKAIEMSLKEDKQKKSTSSGITTSGATGSSLYPTVLDSSAATSSHSSTSVSGSSNISKRTVKALYDFEAAEDNEVTFKAGDLISILDDRYASCDLHKFNGRTVHFYASYSDANWWKGQNGSDVGLFPANFVTSDLAVEPEPEFGKGKADDEEERAVTFNEDVEVREIDTTEPVLEIDENLMDETLMELQNTDPETGVADGQELINKEESCTQMGPLIDQKLEEIDRKHLELTQLNEKIKEALNMYDKLMNEMPAYNPTLPTPYMKQPGSMPGMNPYHPQGVPASTYSTMYSHPHMQQMGATYVSSGTHLPGGVPNMYQQNPTAQMQAQYQAANGMVAPNHAPQQLGHLPSGHQSAPGQYPQQVYSDTALRNQATYSNQPNVAPQQFSSSAYAQGGQLHAPGQQFNPAATQPLM